VKLGSLDAWSERRRSNAASYDRLLLEAGAAVGPGAFDAPALPVRLAAPAPAPGVHTFNQYVIRVPAEARDSLRAFLAEHDVGTAVYYPVPLHLQPCFRPLGWAAGDLPVSERAAEETLALPVHPELTAEQIQAVVGRIRQFFGR
jgi:dTDP-4-amino-4,6-dideoxygalactose transaminase